MSNAQTYERREHFAYLPEDTKPPKYSAYRMMKMWAINHREWATDAYNQPYKPIQARAFDIFWNDICLATHYEQYTAVHENKKDSTRNETTRKAVHQQLIILRKVLAECGYADITDMSTAPSEDTLLEDALTSAPLTPEEQADPFMTLFG